MELELDFNSERSMWQGLAIVAVILALIGLAAIGAHVTPLNTDGSPKLISWQDWRLLQAERAYHAELVVLQDDTLQLAALLEARPSPVAAQILAERIAKHTKSGDAALVTARETLLSAALNVRDWAAGTLDRDTAVQSVQAVFELLQP
jgi:hypothetical protein